MRITKPCGGDDPFNIEGGIATVNGVAVKYQPLEQHELLLSDMSLAPPDKDGKCRRLYNRLGERRVAAAHCQCCPAGPTSVCMEVRDA